MTYLWIALLGLAVLIAAVVVIGLLMPERYVGRSRVEYAKSAELVWDALQDYERHPMTGKMKKSVEQQASKNELPAWIEDMGHGERIRVETVAAERPRHMLRQMASTSVPMTSRWEYTLDSKGEGCELTIDGETTIRRGTWHVPIFRVMMVLGGGVKKGLDIQMDMVAQTLGVEARRS